MDYQGAVSKAAPFCFEKLYKVIDRGLDKKMTVSMLEIGLFCISSQTSCTP